MNKRFTYAAGAALVLAGSAAFAADYLKNESALPHTREEIAQLRAERKARPRKAKAAAAKTGPQKVHAGSKPLYGVMYHTEENGDFWGFNGPVQISATGEHTILADFGELCYSGVYFDGKFLQCFHDAQSGGDVGFRIYDATTWEPVSGYMNFTNSQGAVADMLPYGMAYDHTTDRIYGCFFEDADQTWFTEDAQFGYIDFATNTLEPVTIINRELPERMRAMVFDKSGQLYGLAFSGQMYTINKFTGDCTPTVEVELYSAEDDPSFPFTAYGQESMACDWETGDFYLSYGDGMGDSYIAKINPETGGSETLADYSYLASDGWLFGDVFTGLYFIQEAEKPSDVTPAAVTELTVTPDSTLLKANVSFTLPSVDSEGEALDADLTWHVSDGNADLGEGEAHSGEKVTTTVDVTTRGQNQIVVYTTLNGVESRPVSTSAFFGTDTPVIPGLPTVRAAGSKLTVSWMEAYALNGGNLDPVTYSLTRMPDEKVVADGISTTSFVDEIESDIKTQYYYIITPKSGDMVGDAVNSRALYAGKYLALPHFDDFSDEARFMQYPIIDANNDYNIWEYSSKYNGVAMYPANDNAADDYLLIGPFKMEKGAAYTFHTVADGHSFRETISINVGTDPEDVKSFSKELVAPTELDPMKGKKTFDISFEPEESGDYYFAIHACTKGASQYIYVYEIGVKEIGGGCPDVPANLETIPGASTATINFNMPEKNVDGTDAEGLTEARIYRDGELIGTVTEGIAPGAAISYVDEGEVSKGFHSYSVVAVNAEGEGKAAAQQLYRGLDMPGRPSNLRLWEDLETPGLMHATFDHPERGYYGGYVNPDEIDYHIDYLVMGGGAGVITLGKGTDHTFQLPVDATKQDIFAGSVYGSNAAGSVAKSGNWITQICYFGPALSLPISESWPGQTQKSGIWGGQSIDENEGLGDSYWDVSSGTNTSITPQDKDAGMLSLTTKVENGGKRILSPRFAIGDASNPTVVFYYSYSSAATAIELEVLADDKEIEVLKNLEVLPENIGKWIRAEVSLADFKDTKYLQIAFVGHGNAGEEFVAIDNVTISDLRNNDLSVASFEAPVKVDVNNEAEFLLTIRNNGAKAVKGSDYKLRLYKNGELLDEQEGDDLEADAQTLFQFIDTPAVTDPASNDYHAEIAFDADENESDNKTAVKTVRVVISEYPVVTDLEATPGEEILLTWSDPDMSQVPGVSVTETFENYESFIIDNIGPWTLHDGDEARTLIMATQMGVLDYPHIGEGMAWQVFDPAEANILLSAWYARSGSKMLVSFQACENQTRDIDSDDWLISPELNASEQVISFYSRAGHATYAPEVFDFMVSSTGNAPEDFEVLAADVEVPYTKDSWTEYTYRVPAGTRYFAIVHKSFGQVAMLVDDITYIPAGSVPVQLDLRGFNVYRDGVRLNDEPIADNEYLDKDVTLGNDYTYHVTAVWDKGESALSAPVTVKAVSTIDSAVSYNLTFRPIAGAIRIEGGIGEYVSVYTSAGVCVATVKAQGAVDVAVPAAGVYVVKAPGAVAKVAVR